jgi:hypothetical protein
MNPDGRCHCIIKIENRRCFGRTKNDELFCHRDRHNCQNVDPPREQWIIRDEYFEAAFKGNWEIMEECLRQSPSVADRILSMEDSEDEWTATHYAIAGHHGHIVRNLFEKNLHNAPLLELCRFAIRFGNLDIIRGLAGKRRELFSPVCAPHRRELLNCTLFYAFGYGDLHIIEWVRRQDMELFVSYLQKSGSDVLFTTAYLGDRNMFLEILRYDVIRVTKKDGTFLLAILNESDEPDLQFIDMVVDHLLQSGNFDFFELLPYLYEDQISSIIANGRVTVEEKDRDGFSILANMISRCSLKMIRYFTATFHPNILLENNGEFFDRIMRRKDPHECAKWFVENKFIDMNQKNLIDGSTCLTKACQNAARRPGAMTKHINLIVNLVEHGGADIDICDDLNVSPWEYLVPLWQNTVIEEDIEDLKKVLEVFLPRSTPPRHVEIVLLATLEYRALLRHYRDVRRQLLPGLLRNDYSHGLPNVLVDIVMGYAEDT